jgi:hypothetical protein
MLDVIPPAHPTVSMRTRMRDHSGKCKKSDDADEPHPRNDLAYHSGNGDQSYCWDAACQHTAAAIPVAESCGRARRERRCCGPRTTSNVDVVACGPEGWTLTNEMNPASQGLLNTSWVLTMAPHIETVDELSMLSYWKYRRRPHDKTGACESSSDGWRHPTSPLRCKGGPLVLHTRSFNNLFMHVSTPLRALRIAPSRLYGLI